MSSMFRRPGDSSSSSSSSSDGDDRDQDAHAAQEAFGLSRINTLSSTSASADAGSEGQAPSTSGPEMPRNNSHVRELLIHSLLEKDALQQTAKLLGKDISDPEVQERARELYRANTRQLSSSNIIDEKYGSDEMRHHRATAQKGIEAMTRSNLNGLSAVAATGNSQALVLPNTLTALPDLHEDVSSPVRQFFQIYPGLHNDHYTRDFVQLGLIGKGGFGKVFKAKHKLDNFLYAVKRITVGSNRLQKMREHGPQEMEKLLEEVRALARFDHGNIVRYHGAWLEFTSGPVEATTTSSGPNASFTSNRRLIMNAPSYNFDAGELGVSFSELSTGASFSIQNPNSYGIRFESDATAGAEASEDEAVDDSRPELGTTPKQNKRRASQASQASRVTATSVRSTQSHKTAVKADHGEDDDDVEVIPRTCDPHTTSDRYENIMSTSDLTNRLISSRASGPVLTLNIQMSLYDTSLSAYLSPDQATFSMNPELHHCFHPCIALELLTHILSGVEYLHDQGVVHRDLKPGNIFLSLSNSRIPPLGSIDLCTCHKCPAFAGEASRQNQIRVAQRVTPRIGDFGLVAALKDFAHIADSPGAAEPKPVGTAMYRPPNGGSVSEKLDVYALGIVTFEMLVKITTRTERAILLTQLRRGDFPKSFADDLGECGERIKGLLKGMLCHDEKERLSCEEVRREVENLVKELKGKQVADRYGRA